MQTGKSRCTLIGPKGLERVVTALRVIAPELPFEIKFIEITQPEQYIRIEWLPAKSISGESLMWCVMGIR